MKHSHIVEKRKKKISLFLRLLLPEALQLWIPLALIVQEQPSEDQASPWGWGCAGAVQSSRARASCCLSSLPLLFLACCCSHWRIRLGCALCTSALSHAVVFCQGRQLNKLMLAWYLPRQQRGSIQRHVAIEPTDPASYSFPTAQQKSLVLIPSLS